MKKAILISCLIGGFTFMFPSFAVSNSEKLLSEYTMPAGYSEVSQNIAYALIEKNKGVLIDVRSPEEFAEGHIEGAINIPVETIKDGQNLQEVPDLNKPLLLYCRTGRRATVAGHYLVNAGYKHVVNFGGVSTWQYGLIQDND